MGYYNQDIMRNSVPSGENIVVRPKSSKAGVSTRTRLKYTISLTIVSSSLQIIGIISIAQRCAPKGDRAPL